MVTHGLRESRLLLSAQNVRVRFGTRSIRGLTVNELESARRILEVLKDERQMMVLRDLAKLSGFKSVANVDFKKGFNFLQKRGIIKLRQSGWRSEKRGGKNHPAAVILLADVYEVEDFEKELKEDLGIYAEPSAKFDETKLVPVLSLFGNPTFVSKEAYEFALNSKNRRSSNMWQPLKAKDRAKLGLPRKFEEE